MIDGELQDVAARVGARLVERGETVAVADSATGGLIAAALLAVPGASAYFIGGIVVYTGEARRRLLGIGPADLGGLRPATEAYAALVASRLRERLGTGWAVAETGAAGPTGNRYGDPAGHSCWAVDGPVRAAGRIATGSADRVQNMQAFAVAALHGLEQSLR